MAKKILHSDLIQPGNPAIETIQGLQMLLQQVQALRGELKKTKTELTKTFKGAGDVKSFANAEAKATEITKKKAAADKLAESAAASLERQRQKGLAQMAAQDYKGRLSAEAQATKQSQRATQELQRSQASLNRQRQSGLSAMARQESKERDLRAAAFGEARSLEALEKKVKALIVIRKRLDLSTAQGRAEQQRLTRVIEQGTRSLKQHDAAIGIHNRNVGNYKSALQGIRNGYLATVGAIGVAIMAVRKIGKIYGDNIRLYNEQVRAESKVRTAVTQTGKAAGYSAEQLIRLSSELQAVTLYGDEQVLNEVTAQLLTFPNIVGENFERAQEAILSISTVLDRELLPTSIMVGKALQNPIKGLERMTRMGIDFSEEQKEVIKALAGSNRLYEAQAMMLDEINRQYGEQARNIAKVGTGPMVQLKNAWGDLREEIGRVTLTGTDFSRGMTQMLKNVTTIIHEDSVPAWRKLIALAAVYLKGNFKLAAEIDNKNKKIEDEAAALNITIDTYKKLKGQQDLHYKQTIALSAAKAKAIVTERELNATQNPFKKARLQRNLGIQQKAVLVAENNVLKAKRAVLAFEKKAKSEQDAFTKSTEKLTQSQINLIESYNEATGEELKYTKSSLSVAQDWIRSSNDKKNAIETLREEITALETSMNIAILQGKPFKSFLDKLAPKKQQIADMEEYAKFVTDLAMGTLGFDPSVAIKDETAVARQATAIYSEILNTIAKQNEKDPAIKALFKFRGEIDEIEITGNPWEAYDKGRQAQKDKTGIAGLKEALGLDDQGLSDMKAAINVITSEFSKLYESRKQQAEDAYNLAKQNTDQTIELLQIEYEKRSQGLANNVSMMETTLATQKRLQQEALEDQKRANIMTLRMNQLEAVGNMIVATTNVFKENSKIGPWGVVAAIAQVAAMIGSFVGFQNQIRSLKMEQGGRFTEGDRGVIIGDRHSAASGGERLSDQIQAEDGEKVYVLSRQHSKSKQGKMMDEVFDRIQRGEDLSVNSMNKVILPRLSVMRQPDTGWMQVVIEQRNTNRLLGRMKHYNPVTKSETDLKGNTTIYH